MFRTLKALVGGEGTDWRRGIEVVRECRHCGQTVPRDATACQTCGETDIVDHEIPR